jgi:hypothetical protein
MMRHNIAEKISQKIGLTDADPGMLTSKVEIPNRTRG